MSKQEALRRLNESLKQQHHPITKEDPFQAVEKEIAMPLVPFPDCHCLKCPNFKKCYGAR